jgi:sugar phosphate isomerase/epimerase
MKRFPLSAMLTSLPLDFAEAVARAKTLGFTHVDVVALVDRPPAHLEALAEAGLLVACASLGRALPEGCALDVAEIDKRRIALDLMKRQIADTAMLGATRAYIVPPTGNDPETLSRFAEGCALLAEYAARRMVRLCLEPVPGRALASATETLDWLESMGLNHLSLLLDVGHCLISGEDPAAVVRRVGPRLGHVHLDDNDGIGDLHWALCTGRLTRDILQRFLAALHETDYPGVLAFEFHPQLANPQAALVEGKRLLEDLA